MGKRYAARVHQYGVAIVAVAVAVLLRWLIDPWVGDYLPLSTLYGAVAVAVWYGGYAPALLAVVLGYLACDYLFIEPRSDIAISDARGLVGLLVYLFSCAVIVGFGEAMHVARRSAEVHRRQLELEA